VRGPVDQPRRPRSLLVPGLLTLAAFMVLVGLGTWQLQRKAWKEALIDTLTLRLGAAPVDLPSQESWARLNAKHDEFRRVRFRARMQDEALVYTIGSVLRSDVSGPGYWVFAPAELDDGNVVVINRGFVPEGRQDPRTRAEGQAAGPVDVVGVMRWPEQRSWYTPRDDPVRNVWFVRDHLAIAAAKGLSNVAPFFIDQEAPVPAGGLPRPGPLKINLRNDHFQYALTWYGLATVLVFVFAAWAWRREPSARR
jgi:surfeit locus 1 family protein